MHAQTNVFPSAVQMDAEVEIGSKRPFGQLIVLPVQLDGLNPRPSTRGAEIAPKPPKKL
jgi:hypothetical protein